MNLTFEQLCALKDNGYSLEEFKNEKNPFKKLIMVSGKVYHQKLFNFEETKLETVNDWVKIGDGVWCKDKKIFIGEVN